MRVVLTLPVPDADLTLENVIAALQPTSWLPRQNPVTESLRAQQIQRWTQTLPSQIREQLGQSKTVYIQVGTGVEGIVSLEKERAVAVRLFAMSDDIDSIKHAVTTVASGLPAAFAEVSDQGELALENEVVIRQNQDGRTLAKGRHRDSAYSWLPYVSEGGALMRTSPAAVFFRRYNPHLRGLADNRSPRVELLDFGGGPWLRRTNQFGVVGSSPDHTRKSGIRAPRLAQRKD